MVSSRNVLLTLILGVLFVTLGAKCSSAIVNETRQVLIRTPSGVIPTLGWSLLPNEEISFTLSVPKLHNLGWIAFGVSSSDGLGSSLMFGGPTGGAAVLGRLSRPDASNVLEYSLLGPTGDDIIPWFTRGPSARDVKKCISEFCLAKAQTCLANPHCAGTLRCGLTAVNISTARLAQNLTLISDINNINTVVECARSRLMDPENNDQIAAAGGLLRVAGCALEFCTKKVLDGMPKINIVASSIVEDTSLVTMQATLSQRRISNIDFGSSDVPVVMIVAFGSLDENGDILAHHPSHRTFISLNLNTGEVTMLPLPAHLIVHTTLASIGLGILFPIGTCLSSWRSVRGDVRVFSIALPVLGILLGAAAGITVASVDAYVDLTNAHFVLGFVTIAMASLGLLFRATLSVNAPQGGNGPFMTGQKRRKCLRFQIRARFFVRTLEIIALALVVATMFTGFYRAMGSAVAIPMVVITAPVLGASFCGMISVILIFMWRKDRSIYDRELIAEKDTSSNRELVETITEPDLTSTMDNTTEAFSVRETIVPFYLAWENLTIYPSGSFTSKSQTDIKPIVHSAIGISAPRTFTAILGPSGSGKSTLLDVIALRVPVPAGGRAKLTVNGIPAVSFPNVRRFTAFVPQQDHFHEYLTVRETLVFMSAMMFPERKPDCERQLRLDQIIVQLELSHILDTRVGGASFQGISGGERKRLSIALQLFKSVSCLILDEPSTGLDSQFTLRLLQMLRSLANEGRSVIATIHQPSQPCFELFDRIVLMSRGYTILSGARTDMIAFIEEIGRGTPSDWNPAEWLIQLVDSEDENVESLHQSHDATTVVLEAEGIHLTVNTTVFADCIRVYYEQVNPSKLIQDPGTIDHLVKYTWKQGLRALEEQLIGRYQQSILPFVRTLSTTNCELNDDHIPNDQVPSWNEVAEILQMFARSAYSVQLVQQIASARGDALAKLKLLEDRSKEELFSKAISDENPIETSDKRVDPKVDYSEINSRGTQLKLLIVRSLKLIRRNPQAFRVQLLQTVVLGVLLGALYSEARFLETGQFQQTVTMAMIVSMVALVTVSSGTQVAFDDRLVLQKEMREAIYSPTVYFQQRMVTSIPIGVAISLGIIVPSYFWVGLRPDRAAFGFFILVNVLVVFTFDAAVYAIALLAADVHTAYAVANFFEAITMFFSGVSIPAYAMPVYLRWVHYLSPFSYAFGAVVVNQFENSDDGFYIDIVGVVIQNKWLNLLILAGFGVIFRVFGWVATVRMFNQHRFGNAS